MMLLKKLRNRKPKQPVPSLTDDGEKKKFHGTCDFCGRESEDIRGHFGAGEITEWYCKECWERDGEEEPPKPKPEASELQRPDPASDWNAYVSYIRTLQSYDWPKLTSKQQSEVISYRRTHTRG